MGFEGLLGNEQLKNNLRASVGRGRASHFYLITGPEGSWHSFWQLPWFAGNRISPAFPAMPAERCCPKITRM